MDRTRLVVLSSVPEPLELPPLREPPRDAMVAEVLMASLCLGGCVFLVLAAIVARFFA